MTCVWMDFLVEIDSGRSTHQSLDESRVIPARCLIFDTPYTFHVTADVSRSLWVRVLESSSHPNIKYIHSMWLMRDFLFIKASNSHMLPIAGILYYRDPP